MVVGVGAEEGLIEPNVIEKLSSPKGPSSCLCDRPIAKARIVKEDWKALVVRGASGVLGQVRAFGPTSTRKNEEAPCCFVALL